MKWDYTCQSHSCNITYACVGTNTQDCCTEYSDTYLDVCQLRMHVQLPQTVAACEIKLSQHVLTNGTFPDVMCLTPQTQKTLSPANIKNSKSFQNPQFSRRLNSFYLRK